jgi:hypothetical protein
MLSNYSELKSEIALWLNREDLTAQIPTFIHLLEARLNREIRVREMEVRSTANLVNQFVALPADFLSMKQLQLNTNPVTPLIFCSAHELDVIRRDVGGVAQKPRNFSIIGNEIEVAPAPDTTYQLEMVYHGKVPALSDAAPSNWLLASHPDLYLYGSLLQAAPYLHSDERVPVWDKLVLEALEQIRIADERARAGNTPLRARIKPY